MEYYKQFYGGECTMTKDKEVQIGLCFLIIIIIILIIVALFAGNTAQTTVILPDCGSNCGGYEWSGSTLLITKPGEYAFSANVPGDISIEVQSTGVTLDGSGVTLLHGILGQPDLDLKNVTIYVDDPDFSDSAITECRNIENSSIVITSGNVVAGIGAVYGNIDDTTSITVMGRDRAFGVYEVYGTISGGTFTVTGENIASAVDQVSDGGIISGGTFTVTGENTAAGVGQVYGTISGGTFTMTGGDGAAGVLDAYGTISGGLFTVMGEDFASAVDQVSGTISGGIFAATGNRAAGVGTVSDGGTISGATFTVNGNTSTGVNQVMDGGTISDGTFTVTGGLAAGVLDVSGIISDGTFIVNGNNAGGVYQVMDGGTISGGTFTVNGKSVIVTGKVV